MAKVRLDDDVGNSRKNKEKRGFSVFFFLSCKECWCRCWQGPGTARPVPSLHFSRSSAAVSLRGGCVYIARAGRLCEVRHVMVKHAKHLVPILFFLLANAYDLPSLFRPPPAFASAISPVSASCTHGALLKNGSCTCHPNYHGNLCETHIRPVVQQSDSFVVPSTTGVFFVHDVETAGRVDISLLLGNPQHRNKSIQSTNSIIPVLFVSRAPALSSSSSQSQSPLQRPPLTKYAPSGDDVRRYWLRDRGGYMFRRMRQTVSVEKARVGDKIYMAIYRNPSWFLTTSLAVSNEPPMHVSLNVRECGNRKCSPDPSESALAYQITGTVTVFALPVVLGTLALLTVAACARAWARVLRRRTNRSPFHIGTSSPVEMPDRLSPSETEVMFPRFVFEKAHAAALGASGENSCAVCLSGYEEGELLRRLRCGHSYHADCLDGWLDTNASCPRCRKPARIRIQYTTRLVAFRVALIRFIRNRFVGAIADRNHTDIHRGNSSPINTMSNSPRMPV